MCGYCGCSEKSDSNPGGSDVRHAVEEPSSAHNSVAPGAPEHGQHGVHDHAAHDHGGSRVLELGQAVLAKNDKLAERVRGILLAKGICAINLVSSPGSGKTTLLEKSVPALQDRGLRVAILVGDLATDNDAVRLRETGAPAIQITTGNVCHLDAHMVLHGFEHLNLDDVDVLFFENVGNLVCPASFDLGEDLRVVLTSTTEGEDKPRKYPAIYQGAQLALITKTDLCEVLEVDMPALRSAIADVAPGASILELSARKELGLDAWCDQVLAAAEHKRAHRI